MNLRGTFAFGLAVIAILCAGCTTTQSGSGQRIVVSVKDQKMVRLEDGIPRAIYPVSTSKYGLGDRVGSNATPTGILVVAKKIGDNAPLGAVFKSRQPTGEVLPPNAPGRDPIVTRVLWLAGKQPQNQNAFRRLIYIHGTTEEKRIGRPASYGCIRMKSNDVAELYDSVAPGTQVEIQVAALPPFWRKPIHAVPRTSKPDPSVPSETTPSASIGETMLSSTKKPSVSSDVEDESQAEVVARLRKRLEARDATAAERNIPTANEKLDKSFLDLAI